MATFQILETFGIANRGFVLAGNILEGTITKGDYLFILNDDNGMEVCVQGVEFLDKRKEKIAHTGLMISEGDYRKIKDLNLIGKVVKTSDF